MGKEEKVTKLGLEQGKEALIDWVVLSFAFVPSPPCMWGLGEKVAMAYLEVGTWKSKNAWNCSWSHIQLTIVDPVPLALGYGLTGLELQYYAIWVSNLIYHLWRLAVADRTSTHCGGRAMSSLKTTCGWHLWRKPAAPVEAPWHHGRRPEVSKPPWQLLWRSCLPRHRGIILVSACYMTGQGRRFFIPRSDLQSFF